MFRWGKEKRLKRDLERQNRPRFADTSFDGYFTMQCLGEMAELKKGISNRDNLILYNLGNDGLDAYVEWRKYNLNADPHAFFDYALKVLLNDQIKLP